MDGFINSRSLMTTRKIIVENGIYHVTQRAPGKEVIFVENCDYLKFISMLKETAQKFKIEIFCFALLPNHLHLLLRIKDANLSEAMRYLFKKYAQWFNIKYERKGHVFCGAYRAAFCYDDQYLIAASVYIHLNPLKARLTNDIFKYKWTSLSCYVRKLRNNPFVRNDQILEMFGEEGYRVYKRLIEETRYLKYKNVIEDKNAIKDFDDDFFNFFKEWTREKDIGSNKLAHFFAEEKRIDQFIEEKKRKFKFTDKKGFLYLVQQLRARGYTYKEIARKLQIGRATIYRFMGQKY